MKEPALPDALAAAARVKDLARDVAAEVRGAAVDVAEGYRRSTRFFKLRLAVVASWALLSAVTLWAACPSSGARNPLGAEVRLETGGLLGAQVMVKNTSPDNWTDVVLTLDGGWSLDRRTVRSGDSLVVGVAQFRKEGAAPPKDLAPASLTLECKEGRITAPLAAR